PLASPAAYASPSPCADSTNKVCGYHESFCFTNLDLHHGLLGMRKRLIAPIPPSVPGADWDWLDVRKVALVEVTSEDKTHPIESALVGGEKRGWRAAEPGPQTIRLLFRQAAKGQTDSAGFRGNRNQAHSGVHPPLVSGRWPILSRNRAPAVEFQSARDGGARSRITLSSSLMLRCLS